METKKSQLSLHRETIRVLNAQALVLARGGRHDEDPKGDGPIYFPPTTSPAEPIPTLRTCDFDPTGHQ